MVDALADGQVVPHASLSSLLTSCHWSRLASPQGHRLGELASRATGFSKRPFRHPFRNLPLDAFSTTQPSESQPHMSWRGLPLSPPPPKYTGWAWGGVWCLPQVCLQQRVRHDPVAVLKDLEGQHLPGEQHLHSTSKAHCATVRKTGQTLRKDCVPAQIASASQT